jgi:hypothetical protein
MDAQKVLGILVFLRRAARQCWHVARICDFYSLLPHRNSSFQVSQECSGAYSAMLLLYLIVAIVVSMPLSLSQLRRAFVCMLPGPARGADAYRWLVGRGRRPWRRLYQGIVLHVCISQAGAHCDVITAMPPKFVKTFIVSFGVVRCRTCELLHCLDTLGDRSPDALVLFVRMHPCDWTAFQSWRHGEIHGRLFRQLECRALASQCCTFVER